MRSRIQRTRSRRPALCSLAAVLLGLSLMTSACSSAGSADSSSGGGSSSSSSVIALGNIGTYSGTNSTDFVSAEPTLEAWADYVNAHGGIEGHQVKLYILDDAGSASQALTDAKELVQQDHVVAMVGEMSTPSSTWESYIDQAGIPVVGGNPSDTLFFQNPNFYPSGATANLSFASVIKAVGGANAKGAFFYCTESPLCSQLQPIVKQAYSAAGGSVANISPITSSSPNFTSQCLAARSAGVESIYTAVPAETLVSIAENCAQQKYNPYFLTDMLSVTPQIAGQLSKITGFQMLDNSNDAPYFATSLPAIATFQAAARKYAPSALNPQTLTENAVSAWAAGQLLSAAVKASGSTAVTSSSIKDGLYALPKGTTLGGLTPPLTFSKGKPAAVGCIYVAGVTSAGLTMPKGSGAFC
jgi:branched-chain amino acid transport system substrate-binding protein